MKMIVLDAVVRDGLIVCAPANAGEILSFNAEMAYRTLRGLAMWQMGYVVNTDPGIVGSEYTPGLFYVWDSETGETLPAKKTTGPDKREQYRLTGKRDTSYLAPDGSMLPHSKHSLALCFAVGFRTSVPFTDFTEKVLAYETTRAAADPALRRAMDAKHYVAREPEGDSVLASLARLNLKGV